MNRPVKNVKASDYAVLSGRSDVRCEKERGDGLPSRQYYIAYFKKALFGKSYSRPMWQDFEHSTNGVSCVWKRSPSPYAIDSCIGDRQEGVRVVDIELNAMYIFVTNDGRQVCTTRLGIVVLADEELSEVIESRLSKLSRAMDEEIT